MERKIKEKTHTPKQSLVTDHALNILKTLSLISLVFVEEEK